MDMCECARVHVCTCASMFGFKQLWVFAKTNYKFSVQTLETKVFIKPLLIHILYKCLIKMLVLFLVLTIFNLVYAPPNKEKCHCGIHHYQHYPARIFQGDEVPPDEHPWAVLIKSGLDTRPNNLILKEFGGVLISTRHVLTAASEIRYSIAIF